MAVSSNFHRQQLSHYVSRAMPDAISSLNVINVASPCPADWGEMAGDDRKRFCSQCNLHVYNLSDMSETEALKLVNGADGRLCVRFFRREDGTMLTRDCPVGLRAVRVKFARMWASTVAMFGALTVSSLLGRSAPGEEAIDKPVDPKPLVLLKEIKGDVCITPAQIPLDKLGAVRLVELLKTARERDADKTGGMPDPLDPDVILESERQSLEARISAKDWKMPAIGSQEYEKLLKQLTSVLKPHPDLVQLLLLHSIVAPPMDAFGPPILGKMVAPVRPFEHMGRVRRVLPE